MVNLTETAEAYLNATVKRGWKSWGLDGNYQYWTGHHYSENEHPILGTVNEYYQDSDCERPEPLQNRLCRERFTWIFKDGIWSPFQLLVNVTVTHVEGESETFELDLNNATSITRPQRLGLNVMRVMYTRRQACHFHALVSFNGSFAYKIKERRGDMPDYYAVGIGYLGSWKRGLVAEDIDVLKYNMSGTLKHLIVCTNQKKRKSKATKKTVKSNVTST
nr:uncharacterized protein LOC129386584 [Dermacentor andersoni]